MVPRIGKAPVFFPDAGGQGIRAAFAAGRVLSGCGGKPQPMLKHHV